MKEKVSILTRCGNRLEHARYTLPRMLAQDYQNLEVVIVDYNSTDGLIPFLWKEYMPELDNERLSIVRYDNGGEFHHAHAWNLAIKAAAGDILVFVDIDHLINTALVLHVVNRLGGQQKMFARPIPADMHHDACGFIVARKEDVLAVRGYNEQLHGWGYEDGDFIRRLILYGCDCLTLNLTGMLIPIEHPDDVRLSNVPQQATAKLVNRDINCVRATMLQQYHGYLANIGADYGRENGHG